MDHERAYRAETKNALSSIYSFLDIHIRDAGAFTHIRLGILTSLADLPTQCAMTHSAQLADAACLLGSRVLFEEKPTSGRRADA
jgi:hypothetical protein